MIDWSAVSVELSRKLDPAHVRPAKAFGPKGDYIEGWHAMAEANRIFGFGGWQYEITECTCVSQAPREIGQAKKPGFGVTYTAKVRANVAGAGHAYLRVEVGAIHVYLTAVVVNDLADFLDAP